MSEKMFPVCCDFCGKLFYARARNAKYCPACAQKRKKAQDSEAWMRRKNKAYAAKHAIKPEEIRKKELLVSAEKEFAKSMNIPYDYLSRWKLENKAAYARWLVDMIDSGALPDDIC